MNAGLVCAILAAGAASRFGSRKTALAFGEHSFVERALEAAHEYSTVIVVAADDEGAARAAVRFGARVVVNEARERGMSHSLRLANRALSTPHAHLAVLLVDTPLVDADVVRRVFAAAQHTDIAFPISADGRPGHPVVFGARARRAIEHLPDGDTIRTLRDDPRFSRTPLRFDDDRPFTDVDTPADYRALAADVHHVG